MERQIVDHTHLAGRGLHLTTDFAQTGHIDGDLGAYLLLASLAVLLVRVSCRLSKNG